MKEEITDMEEDVAVGEHLVNVIKLADDQTAVYISVGLRKTIKNLTSEVEYFVMKINLKNTEVMGK